MQQPTIAIENFDSCFQVIAGFIDALQKNFKADTQYTYPLMTPQANVLFALDAEAADKMKTYIGSLLIQQCGFGEQDFRFVTRHNGEAGGLFKLRLEFEKGLTFDMISKLAEHTQELEQRILQRKSAE